MDITVFKEIVGNVVILGHHNADPDAIGAAIGIKELIETLSSESIVVVVMPKDISSLSRSIIDELGLDIFEEYHNSFEVMVIVDTSSLNQLGVWEEKVIQAKKLIVIDHHSRNIESNSDHYFIDEDAHSTSEIVYQIMKESGLNPTVETAKALLAGIIFDSKFLSIGSSSMFETISELLTIVGDISEVRRMFTSEFHSSEKKARLKSAQRMEYVQLNNWIIANSELSSFQSSGARALVSIGADVAIVSGKDRGETRSSLRSTNRFYNETGIHLGELVSLISEGLDGDGSGHPTAAGFNGECDVPEFNNLVLQKLRDMLQ